MTGSGEMDDGVETLVGFVGAHGDAFELFEFAEEILDQVTPFVHFVIERNRLCSPRMLRDDDLGATLKMKPSSFKDRVVDVMEELVEFTLLMRDVSHYLTGRYFERKESAEALAQWVNLATAT